MKAFSNVNPRDLHEAVTLLNQAHQQGHSASIVVVPPLYGNTSSAMSIRS